MSPVDWPRTFSEAQSVRYGTTRDNPLGTAHCSLQCAADVVSIFGRELRQCGRKPGYGPEQLYCKQHSAVIEELIESEKKFAEEKLKRMEGK